MAIRSRGMHHQHCHCTRSYRSCKFRPESPKLGSPRSPFLSSSAVLLLKLLFLNSGNLFGRIIQHVGKRMHKWRLRIQYARDSFLLKLVTEGDKSSRKQEIFLIDFPNLFSWYIKHCFYTQFRSAILVKNTVKKMIKMMRKSVAFWSSEWMTPNHVTEYKYLSQFPDENIHMQLYGVLATMPQWDFSFRIIFIYENSAYALSVLFVHIHLHIIISHNKISSGGGWTYNDLRVSGH